MRPSSNHSLLPLTALICCGFAAGCVTSSEVYSRTDKMMERLESMREAGYICAPKEYALAWAELEFARKEADHGETMKARTHLEAADAATKDVWAITHTSDDKVKELCVADNDDDGIVNSRDNCPEMPEDWDEDNNDDGCPEFDKDGDGIPDERDQCPKDAEDVDGFEDTDGCPELDNDLDGIQDKQDKCPNQPEDIDKFEDTDGCPDMDNDNDGLPDPKDKCPNEAEDFDGDQDDDGCPDLFKNIVVKEDKIELKQKIFFEFNKARIMPQSFDMLKEVATVMKERPNMKVRIEGHTDDKGNDKYNKKLSEDRAKAVRDFLVKEGVSPDRMIPVGYGEEKPLVPNDSDTNREMNRRVEFFIIEM